MLTINYMRSVKAGTLHVYAVSGTKSEIADFESIQGENFRTDEKTGKPVYFTRRYVGKIAQLEQRENEETGEVYYTTIKSEDYMIKEQIIKDSFATPVSVSARAAVSSNDAELED
jgi:hypothetical protein